MEVDPQWEVALLAHGGQAAGILMMATVEAGESLDGGSECHRREDSGGAACNRLLGPAAHPTIGR